MSMIKLATKLNCAVETALSKDTKEKNRLDIYIQANISEEESKSGVSLDVWVSDAVKHISEEWPCFQLMDS